MSFKTQNKRYVSAIDKFLREYDATHSKSESQHYEIAKYRRIHYLRDHVQATTAKKPAIWEQF